MWRGVYHLTVTGDAADGRSLLALDKGQVKSLDHHDFVCTGTYAHDPASGGLDLDLILVVPVFPPEPCDLMEDGLPRGLSHMLSLESRLSAKEEGGSTNVRTDLGTLTLSLEKAA
ncbi:MAG: hypothetical protein ISR48_02040 [Alphaproteobacteria bacterium]|nr:hypothetical protein [Alphaproteobacteria bacterium]